MGPTITFNLKREDGTWFGYREVEKLASLSGIHLRVRAKLSYHIPLILAFSLFIWFMDLPKFHMITSKLRLKESRFWESELFSY